MFKFILTRHNLTLLYTILGRSETHPKNFVALAVARFFSILKPRLAVVGVRTAVPLLCYGHISAQHPFANGRVELLVTV